MNRSISNLYGNNPNYWNWVLEKTMGTQIRLLLPEGLTNQGLHLLYIIRQCSDELLDNDCNLFRV